MRFGFEADSALFLRRVVAPTKKTGWKTTCTSAPSARPRWTRQRTLAAALDRAPGGGAAAAAGRLPHGLDGRHPGRRSARREVRPKDPGRCSWRPWRSTFGNLNRLQRPIGAMALIALGFFASRFTSSNPSAVLNPALHHPPITFLHRPLGASGQRRPCADRLRRNPAPRRSPGRMEDQNIQQLLLSGGARGECRGARGIDGAVEEPGRFR